MPPCRLLLLDHHPHVRRALCAQLALLAQVQLVGATGDAAEALRLAAQLHPDLLLVEPKPFDGAWLVAQLHDASPNSRLVLYTSYGDPQERDRLLAAGADAYLLKELDLTPLAVWFLPRGPSALD